MVVRCAALERAVGRVVVHRPAVCGVVQRRQVQLDARGRVGQGRGGAEGKNELHRCGFIDRLVRKGKWQNSVIRTSRFDPGWGGYFLMS